MTLRALMRSIFLFFFLILFFPLCASGAERGHDNIKGKKNFFKTSKSRRSASRFSSKASRVNPPVPSTQEKEEKDLLVILDAGHGGKDTGAKSIKNNYEEKFLTLETVNFVKGYLTKMGYEVEITRKEDDFIELERRAEIANELHATVFVSIHYNYCPNVEAEGIEIFYYKDEKNPYTKRLIESRRLGEAVLSGIVHHTGAVARGVKKANFAVIRETKMPAILIEGGFLSNPDERQRILDIPYRQYLAFGIASGIDRYLKNSRE